LPCNATSAKPAPARVSTISASLGIFLEVGRYFFIYGVGARFAEAVAIYFRQCIG